MTATVLVGDAGAPPVGDRRFDVVLARHQLVLIEGRWGGSAAVGLTAAELTGLLGPPATSVTVEQLAADAALWGRTVNDACYTVIVEDPGGAIAVPGPRPEVRHRVTNHPSSQLLSVRTQRRSPIVSR